MWDLPRPGLKPVSPALAGGFLTTAPPGKPSPVLFFLTLLHLLLPPSLASLRAAWGWHIVACGGHGHTHRFTRAWGSRGALCPSGCPFLLLLLPTSCMLGLPYLGKKTLCLLAFLSNETWCSSLPLPSWWTVETLPSPQHLTGHSFSLQPSPSTDAPKGHPASSWLNQGALLCPAQVPCSP